MNELHDRINRVINTRALEACLERNGIDFIEFQFSWHKLSQGGGFASLPAAYQEAIVAGEAELQGTGEMDFAAPAPPVCA